MKGGWRCRPTKVCFPPKTRQNKTIHRPDFANKRQAPHTASIKEHDTCSLQSGYNQKLQTLCSLNLPSNLTYRRKLPVHSAATAMCFHLAFFHPCLLLRIKRWKTVKSKILLKHCVKNHLKRVWPVYPAAKLFPCVLLNTEECENQRKGHQGWLQCWRCPCVESVQWHHLYLLLTLR